MDTPREIEKIRLRDFELLSVQKFVILSIASLGLYDIWWLYKTWRFFKEKDDLDIMPALRALFSILFLYGLFENIQKYARSNGVTKGFSSIGCFIGFFITNFSGYLPDPYWLIAFFGVLFLIPALHTLNDAIRNSGTYELNESGKYNGRQIAIVIFGFVFYVLTIMALFIPEELESAPDF